MPRSLVERVASRYRMAAFIPDKFFEGYQAALKKLLATRLSDGALCWEASKLIDEKVVPLLTEFINELIKFVPQAKSTMVHRLEARVRFLKETVARGLQEFGRGAAAPYPAVTTVDHVLQYIEIQISKRVRAMFPTLGKALTTLITIDGAQVKAFAQRVLKKATPEERAAIDASDDWGSRNLELKYGFYARNVDKSVARLIKKEKVEINYLEFFQFVRGVLEVNYSGEPVYRQFDLKGMKVVIDDSTVTSEEIEKYVKYLDAAYHKLRAKRLGRAWYGTVYIDCDSCGGVNQNTGGGVGGHFNIEDDHVKVFVRPSKFIIKLMAHELGHRYWFKSMTPGQRGKFESVVRAHKELNPGDFNARAVQSAADKAEKQTVATLKTLTDDLEGFLATPITLPVEQMLRKFNTRSTRYDFFNVPIQLPPTKDAEAARRFDEARKARDGLVDFLDRIFSVLGDPSGPVLDDTGLTSAFEKRRAAFVEAAKEHATELQKKAFAYIDRMISLSNEAQSQQEKAWDADSRDVTPVSDYGKSNISEAFAEAFAHYVLDLGMNADQEASFKAVLLDKDKMASTVVDRWLEACL
jgi:hypothetical protein